MYTLTKRVPLTAESHWSEKQGDRGMGDMAVHLRESPGPRSNPAFYSYPCCIHN